MFDNWPAELSGASLRHVVDPPRPVQVDLRRAIARDHPPLRDGLALRVKAGGLDLSRTAPGRLHAWARLSSGTWLALVDLTLTTTNGNGHVGACQWVPASSIAPAQTV